MFFLQSSFYNIWGEKFKNLTYLCKILLNMGQFVDELITLKLHKGMLKAAYGFCIGAYGLD